MKVSLTPIGYTFHQFNGKFFAIIFYTILTQFPDASKEFPHP